MKTICFNTGRLYQADGQRITATLHDDGVVTFQDHSRGLGGGFRLGQHCQFNQTEVMHWYDANQYCHDTEINRRAYVDGMQRGGCNTRWDQNVGAMLGATENIGSSFGSRGKPLGKPFTR